jgi:hypothetical protein
MVHFDGINYGPKLFEMEADPEEPMSGLDFKIEQKVYQTYGPNLFYEPIPFEMLKTFETKPQVMMTINKLPAVCHNLTCDFTYIQTAGEVTAFTYTEATRVLQLTGTNFVEFKDMQKNRLCYD